MLVDGDTLIEKFKVSLSVNSFHEEENGYYRIGAGIISHVLHRIPET